MKIAKLIIENSCRTLVRHGQESLTFSHWSGVSPYTSSCELARTCVFGKQSPGVLSLRPPPHFGLELVTPDKICCGIFFSSDLISIDRITLDCPKCDGGKPYRELTAAFLPSSLTRNHSFALVFSTNPPVSVFGTDAHCLALDDFLGSVLYRISQTLLKGIFTALGPLH